MNSYPSWIHRIPEMLEVLALLPDERIDRRRAEELFDFQRAAADGKRVCRCARLRGGAAVRARRSGANRIILRRAAGQSVRREGAPKLRAFRVFGQSRMGTRSWEAILAAPRFPMPPDERPELTQSGLSAHSIYRKHSDSRSVGKRLAFKPEPDRKSAHSL